MTEPILDYDPADSLVDTDTINIFLADANDTGDAAYIAEAMAVVARAKMRIEALEILQRVRQGQEAVHSAADVRTDLGLDD
ncbi:transcriptional regulator [Pseudomonas bubulae]|uniref:transcriptional regulator n=1 Tax=Pseudomonas bubulae TaxID=2316085 RepID=UPI001F32389F|nr:transcriptional regulator [Pseudomonas bubulae]MCF3194402.1 transcriptional regulator [Pseudomonas bubulae]